MRVIHDLTHSEPHSRFVRLMIPLSIMGSLSMLVWMAACNTFRTTDPNSAAAQHRAACEALIRAKGVKMNAGGAQ